SVSSSSLYTPFTYISSCTFFIIFSFHQLINILSFIILEVISYTSLSHLSPNLTKSLSSTLGWLYDRSYKPIFPVKGMGLSHQSKEKRNHRSLNQYLRRVINKNSKKLITHSATPTEAPATLKMKIMKKNKKLKRFNNLNLKIKEWYLETDFHNHNHPASEDPQAHVENHCLTPAQYTKVKNLTQEGLKPAEIL
ncbi:hypothetical protein VP01_3122g2, partial [Puccinia sorghi]